MNIKSFWNREFAVPSFLPTWMFFQRLGGVVAYVAFKLKIHPNIITIIGAILGTYGCFCFISYSSSFYSGIKLAILFSFVYILDCADGQNARSTNQTSSFGKYLDLFCDFYLNILFPISCGYYFYIQLVNPYLLYPFIVIIFFRNILLIIFSFQRSNGREYKPSKNKIINFIQSIYDTPIFYILICISRMNLNYLFMVVNFYAILYFSTFIYKIFSNGK